MRFNYKIFGLVMFVMLICCVSAASATDVDNITVTDDTDVIEIDDAVNSVDDVELEEVDEIVSTEPVTVTDENYGDYFDADGYMTTTSDLTFTGNFTSKSFGNFKINNAVTVTANGATFDGVGFDLLADGLTLNGGNLRSTITNPIYVNANNMVLQNLNIDITGTDGDNNYAIYVEDYTGIKILNNTITFTQTSTNSYYDDYVIKVKNSPGIEIIGNTIVAYLPLKDVDYWSGERTGMDMDLAAVIGIENSNGFNISYNDIKLNVSDVSGDFPTLDAIIVLDSANSYIGHNNITEIDDVTEIGSANYLYAIDVYRCNNLTITNNDIKLVSAGGTFIEGTINGTSAAYGIQLTGAINGITISNNKINTSNNGPNLGIYAQNYMGNINNLNIINNTIYVEGNAGLHSWSLVSGMELGVNDAYVAKNTITVKNKVPYTTNANAYGISLAQGSMVTPTFNITCNTVTLINGAYAVYLMSCINTYVTNNSLDTTYYCCNNAVYCNGAATISGNYCPSCSGTNCNC